MKKGFTWAEITLLVSVSLIGGLTLLVSYLDVPVWKMVVERKIQWKVLTQNLNRKPIGVISQIDGKEELSRKKSESYDYDKLFKDSVVYDRDFIVNGSGGTAKIKLNSGEEFFVFPNSSVVLSSGEDSKMNTEVFRSAKIEILSGVVESTEPQVKIVEKIKYITSPPKVVEKIVEKVVEKVVEKPLVTLSDLNLETPLISGEINVKTNRLSKVIPKFYVDLRWGGDARANKFEVLYSLNDQDFKTLTTTTNSFYRSFEDQVFSGKVFFKVKAFKDNLHINTSSSKPVSFIFQSPTLSEPQDQFLFKGKAYLTWAKTSFTKYYDLEISNTEDFSTSQKFEIKDNFKEISLAPGAYYWRVRSKSSSTKVSPFSESRKFNVEVQVAK